jgi:hypothetical protein
MSEPEDFLARWSRRKRQAAQEANATSDAPAGTAKPQVTVEGAAAGEQPSTESGGAIESGGEPAAHAFDPESLPSLESITAGSDIRAFLAPGVPAELTRAALRRVWTADPAIRDFIGLSENSWDFNAPGSMGGFGPLEMTDELRRQIARMVGRSLDEDRADRAAPTPPEGVRDDETADGSAEFDAARAEMPTRLPHDNVGISEKTPEMSAEEAAGSELPNGPGEFAAQEQDHVATQYETPTDDEMKWPVKRSHGGALPK